MADFEDRVYKFLESLLRLDLLLLIRQCRLEFRQPIYEDVDHWCVRAKALAIVHAPSPIDEVLRALPSQDKRRITEAMNRAGLLPPDSPGASPTIAILSTEAEVDDPTALLLAELLLHREMMIAVATGGPYIQDVNDYYKGREARIRNSLLPGIEYKNPHEDLWSWYHYWSANLPTYRERRRYVSKIFTPVIAAVASFPTSLPRRDPTGWERVDRARKKARHLLQLATAEEDYQQIGLLCREILISLAQEVFDPSIHKTLDGVPASKTDAKRMLEAYIAHIFAGSSNKELRKHATAALDLAVHLQHRRTATKRLASLCLEATESTVAILRIIATTPE